MDLSQSFSESVKQVQELTKRPANDELLNLYGLFKQSTEGNITGDRPGGFDFKAIAKFDAWNNQKGKSKEQAMQDYIAFAQELISKYR